VREGYDFSMEVTEVQIMHMKMVRTGSEGGRDLMGRDKVKSSMGYGTE
jgi:hypothetical protein